MEDIGQKINTGKTKIMIIGRNEEDEGREYTVEGTRIEEVSTQKILGMICTAKKGQLMMKRCDIGTLAKIRKRVGLMKRVQLQSRYDERNEMNIEALTSFHRTIIAPTYEYGAQLRIDTITRREWKALEKIQYEVALYILQITPNSKPSRAAVYKELGWITVESRFKYLQCRWWKRIRDGNCGVLVRECVERWREEEKEGRDKRQGRKSWWEVTEKMMEELAGPKKEAIEMVRGREKGEKGEMKEMGETKWKRWLIECLKAREWESEEEKNRKKKEEAGEKEDKRGGEEQLQRRTRWDEYKELMSRERNDDRKRTNEWKIEGYLEKRSKANKIRAQLRLGVFPTMEVTGRWTEPTIPWEKRICKCCEEEEVESIQHMMGKCEYYEPERKEMKERLEQLLPKTRQWEEEERWKFTLGKDWRDIFIDNKEVAKEKKEKIRKCIDETLMKIVEKREKHAEIKKERRRSERDNEDKKERKKEMEKAKTKERKVGREERLVLRLRREGKGIWEELWGKLWGERKEKYKWITKSIESERHHMQTRRAVGSQGGTTFGTSF